jgi:hypothetical protein
MIALGLWIATKQYSGRGARRKKKHRLAMLNENAERPQKNFL